MRQLPSSTTPLGSSPSDYRRFGFTFYVRAPELAFNTLTPFATRLELQRAYKGLPLASRNNEPACVSAPALEKASLRKEKELKVT